MTLTRISWPGAVRFLLVVFLGFATDVAQAQGSRRTNVTVTGFPLTTTGTSVLDFDAGSVTVGSTVFTIALTTNNGGGGFSPRVTTVRVRCNLPCPASGTLAASGLEWRRADLGTWNPITTTFVTVESRTATFGGDNDPWNNSLFWRYVLSYTATPPRAATQYFIQYQLQVTAP